MCLLLPRSSTLVGCILISFVDLFHSIFDTTDFFSLNVGIFLNAPRIICTVLPWLDFFTVPCIICTVLPWLDFLLLFLVDLLVPSKVSVMNLMIYTTNFS
uniref:Uncharacterized protein n=1 Tax=Ixodes ricinus TaxID=34613 RepID=A0A6B0UEN5_IXORI